MKIDKYDCLLAVFSLILPLGFGVIAAALIRQNIMLPPDFLLLTWVTAFFVIFYGTTLVMIRIGNHFFASPRDTAQDWDSSGMRWWKLVSFIYIFHLGPFYNGGLLPIPLRAMFYRLLGANIGSNVMIGGKLIDPHLISIGDNTQTGEDSILSAHSVEKETCVLSQMEIGANVVIGAKSVIMPECNIKDNAIVGIGAIVSKGTIINSNEIWAGVPARKIKDRESSLQKTSSRDTAKGVLVRGHPVPI
jgi:acetyltransferase-like isoleucine patch superfamily enzyme